MAMNDKDLLRCTKINIDDKRDDIKKLYDSEPIYYFTLDSLLQHVREDIPFDKERWNLFAKVIQGNTEIDEQIICKIGRYADTTNIKIKHSFIGTLNIKDWSNNVEFVNVYNDNQNPIHTFQKQIFSFDLKVFWELVSINVSESDYTFELIRTSPYPVRILHGE